MYILRIFIILFLILSLFFEVLCFARNAFPDGRTVRMPRIILLIQIAFAGFSVAIYFTGICFSPLDWAWIVAFVLAVVSFGCAVTYYCQIIRYDKSVFSAQRFFKTYEFRYEDIERIVIGYAGYTLHVNGKIIYICKIASGKDDFLQYAVEQHCESTKDDLIIEKKIPFHGFVWNPWEIVITLCVVMIFSIGVSGYVTWSIVKSEPQIPDSLSVMEAQFEGYEEYDRTLTLFTSNQQMQVFTDDISNKEALLSLVRDGEKFSLSLSTETENENDIPIKIWKLQSADGTIFVSPETVIQNWKTQAIESLAVLWGIAILVCAFSFFVFYVCNHADKHPKLVKLILRKSAIT